MAFWKEHFEGRNVVWRKGSAMDGIRLQLREGSFVLLFKILPLEGEYIQLYTPLPYNAIEEEFMKVGWMTIYYAVLHSNAPQKFLCFYFLVQKAAIFFYIFSSGKSHLDFVTLKHLQLKTFFPEEFLNWKTKIKQHWNVAVFLFILVIWKEAQD